MNISIMYQYMQGRGPYNLTHDPRIAVMNDYKSYINWYKARCDEIGFVGTFLKKQNETEKAKSAVVFIAASPCSDQWPVHSCWPKYWPGPFNYFQFF